MVVSGAWDAGRLGRQRIVAVKEPLIGGNVKCCYATKTKGSSGVPGRQGSKPRMKHGLNTDQDSEQGPEEKREVTERGCVAFSKR